MHAMMGADTSRPGGAKSGKRAAMRSRSLPCLLVVLAAACTPDPTATRAAAPALGKTDGTDAADRGCAIVLDHVERAGLSTIDGRSLAWEGELVVSEAGQALGTPHVLYGVFGTWWAVPAEPVDGQPGRFRFRIEEHTIETGVSTTTLTRFHMELAPYLATSDGGRVFDHNRPAGDLDAYELTLANAWSVGADGTCIANGRHGGAHFPLSGISKFAMSSSVPKYPSLPAEISWNLSFWKYWPVAGFLSAWTELSSSPSSSPRTTYASVRP